MPMLLGTKGDDILQWRASAQLVDKLEAGLGSKWGRSSAREADSFLCGLIASLQEELSYESQLDDETAALDRAIAQAKAPVDLQPLQARYRELASAHFRRRNSVLALCRVCGHLHDMVLTRAAAMAEERMLQLGQGSAPIYALLVSGDRGRQETTLYSRNRYLLLHELDSPRFFLFSHQLSVALKEAGVLMGDDMLWHGSLSEWRALLGAAAPHRQEGGQESFLSPLPPFATQSRPGPQPIPEWNWRLEAMADLCFVTGYERLAADALSAAARAIQEQRNREPFLQLARRVIHLPLALGHFGRWRLQRDGEHKGELDLEEFALAPMVMAVRVLAVYAGVHGGGTVQRVRELLNKGALDVDLSERLLKAFQCFMQLRIDSEIRSEQNGAFSNPEEFSQELDARLRASFEAVLNLQKIAYQRLVAQG